MHSTCDEGSTAQTCGRWILYLRPLVMSCMLLAAFGFGWYCGKSIWLFDLRLDHELRRDEQRGAALIDAVVERIIAVESDGDPNKTNRRSSALGLAQFLDQTWLDLIRAHRPDLAVGRSEGETLQLRRDPKVVREITTRLTERNAEMLSKKGLPVTPGTLYLAHFAGGAGAVAILSAPEDADAASAMAKADATGRTKRESITKANPFLERFTVEDLRSWADRKMGSPRLPQTMNAPPNRAILPTPEYEVQKRSGQPGKRDVKPQEAKQPTPQQPTQVQTQSANAEE